MIFQRKKPPTTPGSDQPVMRGRGNVDNDSNPLARRFHPADEPDTIDLQQPAEFSSEPDTGNLQAKSEVSADKLNLVMLNPETGKIYVQPGTGDLPVFLGDEPVLAPTELRHGDHICIGGFELKLISKGKEGS